MKKSVRILSALGAAALLAGMSLPASAQTRASFATFDRDGNGVITQQELDRVRAQRPGMGRNALSFAQMDANKDGYIDQADREAMARQQRDQWFDAADSNKDGSLSRAEFDAAQTRRMAGEHGRGPGRMPAPAPAPTN